MPRVHIPLLRGAALLVSLLALLAGCAPAPLRTSSIERDAPLILVSIDGFRADYLDRGVTPNLARLAADGVRAQAMRPAFPSLTFPNHYTLATGLYPDHHGIVHNIFFDPDTGARYQYNDRHTTDDPHWWGGEPIWVGAEKHGIRAATMFWPGSDTAINGVWPTHWLLYDERYTPEQRVDTLLRWLDLPRRERPRFLTLYFDQVDHAGHQAGPDSAEVNEAVAAVDVAIGRLVAGLVRRGLNDKANLVIVSDHGQANSGSKQLVFMDDLIDVERANPATLGILAGFRPAPDYAAELENKLLTAHDHFRCWRKEAMPERFHYGTNARIPPLECLADVGWSLTTHAWVNKKNGEVARGEHGYDVDAPEMSALFLAAGPAFKHGFVAPAFDNVHVYELLAKLLGIPAAPNDGDPAVTAPMLKSE